ncbi:hypothetical protein EDC96DRAFT_428919, partial [Choanephora cucurbitarum]
YKPKLRKLQAEALGRFIRFETSFSQTNLTSENLYNQYRNEQKEKCSLKSFGLFDHVVELLDSETGYELFLEKMWTSKLSTKQDNRKDTFFDIIRYSLTAFHHVCKSPPNYLSNNERTHFVENIMPSSLSALRKSLDFIEFMYVCELE